MIQTDPSGLRGTFGQSLYLAKFPGKQRNHATSLAELNDFQHQRRGFFRRHVRFKLADRVAERNRFAAFRRLYPPQQKMRMEQTSGYSALPAPNSELASSVGAAGKTSIATR